MPDFDIKWWENPATPEVIDVFLCITDLQEGDLTFELCVKTKRNLPHRRTEEIGEALRPAAIAQAQTIATMLYPLTRYTNMGIQVDLGFYGPSENN